MLWFTAILAYTLQKVLRKSAEIVPLGDSSLRDEGLRFFGAHFGHDLECAFWSGVILGVVWIVCFILRRREISLRV